MKRKAQAVWRGQGGTGSGTISTPNSGLFKDQPYSAKLRFENEDGRAGTNPEELIAAAHAGCYSMALSFGLTGAGFTPEEINTDADLTMNKQDAGWTIESIHLTTRARVPGITEQQFKEIAEKSKAGCPVSRALNVKITLDATLQS
jgi:osmotically inducible protein OsmC